MKAKSIDIRERLNADVTRAMREGDADRRDILRLLLAALKQVEVDEQKTLENADVEAILMKQAKQRRESIVDYEQGGREDLATQERRELAVIETYLPQLMSRSEIEEIASAMMVELGVTDSKEMGKLMGRLMPQLRGKADGRLVNEVVRDLLSSRQA